MARAPWTALIGRRQFNLPQWTRSPAFVEQRSSVTDWLDAHFAVLEQGVPWLRRVGTDVWDYCRGVVPSRCDIALFQPRQFASLDCTRSVITVYGFDGDLVERLDQVREALAAAGWWRLGLPMMTWAPTDGDSMLSWRPTAALGYPSYADGSPPSERWRRSPAMQLSWCTSGKTTSLREDPRRRQASTRNHLVLESSASDYWKLPDAALEDHQHALVVRLELVYPNADSPARRGRTPRHLLPTRPVR